MTNSSTEEQHAFRFQAVDEAKAANRALSALEWLKREFSDRRYSSSDKSLSVRWYDSTEFGATASQSNNNINSHAVNISTQVAYALHDDAQNFVAFCDKVLRYPPYAAVLEANGVKNDFLLPSPDHASDPTDRMFRLTMAWLFLHEQAHLFQDHGSVARLLEGSEEASNNIFEEFFSQSPSSPITGRAAALSHACELSADHEAILLTLQLVIVADEYKFRPETLWLLVAGLTCLFQRFFEEDRKTEGIEASGSHPLPAFRMFMAQRAILKFTMNERVRGYAKNLQSPVQVFNVVSHAMLAATMYWNGRHRHGRAVDDFLNGASAIEEVPDSYLAQLRSIWSEAKPHIVANHFGFGPEMILDLDDLSALQF